MVNRRFSAAVRGFLVIALVWLLALTAVSAAGARPPQNLSAKVKTLTTGLSEFSGRVTSTDPDCVKGRTIKISSRKQALGKAKTDKDGRFLITRKSLRPGTEVTFDLKARGSGCIPLVATLTSP